MTTETWLDLRNIEAWLGGRPVLHNLNLQLTLRQSTTVLGPNGAGKSSLVKLLTAASTRSFDPTPICVCSAVKR